MASRLEALIAEERLEEAAELAKDEGDLDAAIALFRRAMLPLRAADAAERAGRLFDAAALAAAGRDRGRLGELAGRLDDRDRAALSAKLAAQRDHAGAGTVLSIEGRHREAGRAFLAAGDALSAAACFARAGDDGDAERSLERHLATSPTDDRAASLLARLLEKRGDRGGAIAVLAPLGPRADEARAALLSGLGKRGPSKGVAFGRFEPGEPLGTTATAFVVAARDRVTGREVALKLFRPTHDGEGRAALERFFREAEVLRTLASPDIVPFVAFFPEGPCVVTERMTGGSLASRLGAGPLDPSRTAEIARAVARALSVAHRAGVLHRDVKPANVLFDAAGAARLADFGVAHVAQAGATVTAGLLGTLAYMAPEVRRGEPASAASDVASLGRLTLEMLTGDPDGLQLLPEGEGRALLEAMTADDRSARPTADEVASTLGRIALPRPVRDAVRKDRAKGSDGARLVPRDDGAFDDTLLGRPVRLVPLDDATRERVTARAREDEARGLPPAVYRVEGDTAWVDPARFR